MKKIIVLLIVILTGCSFEIKNPYLNLDEIFNEVNSFTYVSDKQSHNMDDYWQSPRETQERKTGDCEDFCIFVMYHAKNLTIPSELLVIQKENSQHAIISLNGCLYEYNGERYNGNYDIKSRKSLNECLLICAENGSFNFTSR